MREICCPEGGLCSCYLACLHLKTPDSLQLELRGYFTTCLQSRACCSSCCAATSKSQHHPHTIPCLKNTTQYSHFFLGSSPSHVSGAVLTPSLNSWHWPILTLCLSKVLGRSTQLQSNLNGWRANKYAKRLIWFSGEPIWSQKLFPICITANTLPSHPLPP